MPIPIIKDLEDYGLTLYDSELIDYSDATSSAELIEDYADMLLPDFIEAVMKDDAVTDIPVVGTLAAAAKAVGTFHDAYLLHKWMVFQKQFRKGTVDKMKLQKWKDAAKNHEKWIQREIELLLVRLDNISERRNVEILCNVYLEYLDGECTEEQFHEAALLLERFVSVDERQLKAIYEAHLQCQKDSPGSVAAVKAENFHCDRMVALGILWVEYRSMTGSAQPWYHITEIGIVIGRAL